ncbi:hypothetical protein H4R23_002065 [Coemansia sp. Cherry 401B]|nr:hypothetical protein IWW54_002888 [Coemansia sp. RSA 2705]KAJ2736164.1 hypothetical protein H4R23_002065 [Coemansia sp. Cherry 401B]
MEPSSTCTRQMLVQWCMSARFFNEATLQASISRIYGEDAPALQDVVDTVNSRLARYSLELRSSMEQVSGERSWALINTKADAIATSATPYSPVQLTILKHLIERIFTDQRGNFALDLHTAVREATAKGPASFSRKDAQEAIDWFCADGWLQSTGGWVMLGQRACTELQAYLSDGFANYVRVCALCKEMATQGVVCGACGAFVHPYCADRLSETSKARLLSCPSCRQPMEAPESFGPGKPGVAHNPAKDDTQADTAGSQINA